MTRALILVAHERRFYEQAMLLATYLREEAGLRRHSVCLEPCWNKEPVDVADAVGLHSAKAYKQPLLIAYFGHGYREGWSYGARYRDDPLQVSYGEIGRELSEHRGPLLVLNECCYAGKIQDHLTWIGGDRVPVGLLAACGAEETSLGEMARDVIAFWRASKPYAPVRRRLLSKTYRERRWGAALDHHFFPKT